MTRNEPMPGVTVEEAEVQQNYGEFPDRSVDQDDWRQTPMTLEQRREYEEGEMQPTRGGSWLPIRRLGRSSSLT